MPDIDFDPTVDYYKELGVAQTSSPDDLKKAYRKLAKEYHPDSTGGDKVKEQRFKSIAVAYEVLSDPRRRMLYDQFRHGPSSGPGSVGDLLGAFFTFFQGDPFVSGRRQPPTNDDPFSGFRPPPGPPPGPPPDSPRTGDRVRASDGTFLIVDGFDVLSNVTISFDEAILGTTVTVATIDARAEVKIPPGSCSGRRLRLRGKGINNPRGFSGDHTLIIQIDVPEELDDEGRALLLKLRNHMRRTKKT